MTPRELSQGDVLAGKYQLLAELGRGGMGAVWRADHLVLRSHVAVKLINARAADSEAIQARFLREAQAAASLRSPHVVQILDFGVHEGVPFMVMELLEGESLAARLGRVGALGPAETARIVTQIARAIQKAHEAGIVHRDLKPDNVFLVHNADEEIVKVLDFGIAKSVSGDGIDTGTQTGAVLGTPHYMSPEQARGTRAVDQRTDLWALGVIAFECMTGRRPFESAVLGDLLVKICTEEVPVPSRLAPAPPGFDAWFQRATERDPDRRFQSATELAEALRAALGGTFASLPPPPASVVPAATVQIGPAAASPVSVTRPAAGSSLAPVLALGLLLLGFVVVAGAVGIGWFLAGNATTSPSASVAPSPEVDAPPLASEAPSASSSARSAQKGAAPKPGGAVATDAGDWQSDVSSATAQAKAAQEQAKKAQLEAAKARAEAAEARKKALGIP